MAAIIGDDGEGRTRHHRGPGQGGGIPWTCKRCGNLNMGPLGQGCPTCGAGTAEENNRALAAVKAAEADHAQQQEDAAVAASRVTAQQLIQGLTTREAQQAVGGTYWVDLPALTPAARLTVATALAFYAEQAESFTTEEIARGLALAWAQHLHRLGEGETDR